MRPFTEDLRQRTLAIPENVGSAEVGARFDVSASFVRKFRRKVREGGTLEAKLYPGRVRRVSHKNEAALREIVEHRFDATLREFCDEFQDLTAVSMSSATMSGQLRMMGISLKERQVTAASWKNYTLTAGIRSDGIVTPFPFPGALNSEALRDWVKEILLPTLRQGDIAIWDNLAVHKDRETAELLRSHGVSL